MHDGESAILSFLQSNPGTYFGRKEIARKAVKRAVYEENQHWLDVPLASLVAQGKIHQNESGFYCWLTGPAPS